MFALSRGQLAEAYSEEIGQTKRQTLLTSKVD